MMSGEQSRNLFKIPSDQKTKQKTNQNPSKKSQIFKCPHAETDTDNDSDQTFFLKFIVLGSMEDTPITFIIEKILSFMIKPKSV